MGKLRSQPFLFVFAAATSAAVAIGFSGGAAAQNQIADPSLDENVAACTKIEGPMNDGKEVYFEASNHCAEPVHCRVWINWQEPPLQVHLEPNTRGRIDVGKTEKTDKFSKDCIHAAV
jgi:hypothetical protein